MADMQTLNKTDFKFPGQVGVYHGKVRDVYDLSNSLLLVATDRYSAFDRNLLEVPHKGELVTAISRWWFEQTKSIVKNHIIGYPDPNVTWGKKFKVIPIEMVVRGYITGVTNTSLWHSYSQGQRDFGTFKLPEGLRKNQQLPEPVITPTTKFEEHDRNLTLDEAVKEGLVEDKFVQQLQEIAIKLFKFGQAKAKAKGLILVDTKYEFGQDQSGEIFLIDEVHTPDSSRYWRLDHYQNAINEKREPDNYDKEFLRLWFKERSDPYKDKELPKPSKEVINEMTNRYQYVYEQLSRQKFVPSTQDDILMRIEKNVNTALEELDA